MNANELFKTIHGMRGTKLERIMDLSDEDAKQYSENLKIDDIKQRIQEMADYLERDVNDFYMNHNSFNPFMYKKGMLNVPIDILNIDYLKQFRIKERIEVQEAELNRCYEEGEFERMLFLIDKPLRFDAFISMFDKIPDNQKYNIFMSIYTSSEYGFNTLPKDIVEKVFALRPKRSLAKLTKQIGYVSEGYVTIYRGQNTESTEPTQAYSWTTNLNTAVFFANRFGNSGEIYEAKVKIENVVDYLTGRNESEIIVLPDDLEDVKLMNLITLDEVEDFLYDGLIDVYHYWVNQMDKDLFEDPDGIHGMRHMKRVLLLMLVLTHYIEVGNNDMEILIHAALYHDIGRTNNDEEANHGIKAIRKIRSLGLDIELDSEQWEYFKYIVENHDVDDEVAFATAYNSKLTNKEHAIKLLKLFKDCDNLDRVRIRDLDTNYLRTDIAKRLVLVAYEFLRGIK